MRTLLNLLLGVVVEVLVGVMLAGLILALAIPLMHRNDVVETSDPTSRIVIVSVLVGAVAVALLRPGSAIHRYRRG
ncbi:MAG: hypothetical protein ABIS29_05950 [Vicinamibacterales bacterium]